MPIVDFNTPEPWDTDRIWRVRARTNNPDSPLYRTRVKLNFHRHVIMPDNLFRAVALPKNLSIGAGDRVLLFGDTYGWMAEALDEAVPSAAFVAVDANPLTQTRKTQTETMALQAKIVEAGLTGDDAAFVLAEIDDGLSRARRTVLDEDAVNNGSRQRIRNELGGAPTHCITAGMFNFLFDSECSDISARLHDMGTGPVFHIVNPFSKPAHGKPEPEPALNWKHISGDAARDTMIKDTDSKTRSLDDEPGIEAKSWKTLLPDDWIVPHTTYNANF